MKPDYWLSSNTYNLKKVNIHLYIKCAFILHIIWVFSIVKFLVNRIFLNLFLFPSCPNVQVLVSFNSKVLVQAEFWLICFQRDSSICVLLEVTQLFMWPGFDYVHAGIYGRHRYHFIRLSQSTCTMLHTRHFLTSVYNMRHSPRGLFVRISWSWRFRVYLTSSNFFPLFL